MRGTEIFMRARLIAIAVLGVLVLGCDREEDKPKPANPPGNPGPVPSTPRAEMAASQPNIAPGAATTKRGPDVPAVGSVGQPPVKAGGDANPVPSVPVPTGTGVGTGVR